MTIDNIGYNYTHGNDFFIYRQKGSDDYLFLLFKSDAVVDEAAVRVGSYMIYEKDVPQYYRASGDAYCNDWIHFSADKSEINRLAEIGIVFNKPVFIGDISDLSELVRKISGEFFSDNRYKIETAQMYLNILMLKICECSEKSSSKHRRSRFDEIRSAIYSTPSNDWSVENLAAELNLSKSRFQHLYKQIYGTSVISDIINSRIEYAKHLLSTTELSVKSIAERCGYSNDVHFVRQFKQKTGSTPGELRGKSSC